MEQEYIVYVDRVERYSFTLNVKASSKDEAERKAMALEDRDKFNDIWCELQPIIETTAYANVYNGEVCLFDYTDFTKGEQQ